jgi:hypothetical protein
LSRDLSNLKEDDKKIVLFKSAKLVEINENFNDEEIEESKK